MTRLSLDTPTVTALIEITKARVEVKTGLHLATIHTTDYEGGKLYGSREIGNGSWLTGEEMLSALAGIEAAYEKLKDRLCSH